MTTTRCGSIPPPKTLFLLDYKYSGILEVRTFLLYPCFCIEKDGLANFGVRMSLWAHFPHLGLEHSLTLCSCVIHPLIPSLAIMASLCTFRPLPIGTAFELTCPRHGMPLARLLSRSYTFGCDTHIWLRCGPRPHILLQYLRICSLERHPFCIELVHIIGHSVYWGSQ